MLCHGNIIAKQVAQKVELGPFFGNMYAISLATNDVARQCVHRTMCTSNCVFCTFSHGSTAKKRADSFFLHMIYCSSSFISYDLDACQPGEFSTTGLANCLKCPVNTYQSLARQQTCHQCPGSTVTIGIGAKSISGCGSK